MSNAKPGKQRTRSSAKKRLKRTCGGKGNIFSQKAAHNHLLMQKSDNNKSAASKPIFLPKGEAKKAAAGTKILSDNQVGLININVG